MASPVHVIQDLMPGVTRLGGDGEVRNVVGGFRVLGLGSRALVASNCRRVKSTQVNVQSEGERSSRVREYRCD